MPVEAVQALETEAAMDPDGNVTVQLAGKPVRVKPVKQWRASGIRAMREGDFDSWAEKALAGDDYEKVWKVIDPTMDDVQAFFVDWKSITGQDSGK
jgi:hypothetical protein